MAIIAHFSPEELKAALNFMRRRMITVLKEKTCLTNRLGQADVRNERLTQEYQNVVNENERHLAAYHKHEEQYKRLLQCYNTLVDKHYSIVNGLTAQNEELRNENQELRNENQEIVRHSNRLDSCLTKTRAAFTQLKQRNDEMSAELNKFVETSNGLEKRLADAWSVAKKYALDLSNLRFQYDQLRDCVGFTRSQFAPH